APRWVSSATHRSRPWAPTGSATPRPPRVAGAPASADRRGPWRRQRRRCALDLSWGVPPRICDPGGAIGGSAAAAPPPPSAAIGLAFLAGILGAHVGQHAGGDLIHDLLGLAEQLGRLGCRH